MPDVPVLLCVHPHPDDEAIACGGVLARAADTGVRAVVVTCTGGEEGENLAGIDLAGDDLATHRRREMADALAALNVTHHHWLGYRDSGMVGTPANSNPDSFHAADLEEAASRLATIIRAVRPQVVVSDDADGSYGHPDHVKANRVTIRAVEMAADRTSDVPGAPWRVRKRYVHTLGRERLLEGHRTLLAAGLASPFGEGDFDSVDDLPFGTDDALVTTEIEVARWMGQKRAAMAAHRSQIGEESFFLNIPEDMTRSLFAVEQFVLEDGISGVPDGIEDDLFAGLDVGVGPPARDRAVAAADVPHGRPRGVDRGDSVTDRDGRPTPDRFRSVLGRFATGISILTSVADGQAHGMTASAIASVSLEPPLVLVCVDRSAIMAGVIERSEAFALTFLSQDQERWSRWFADPDRPSGIEQFEGVPTYRAVTGSPVLEGGVAWVDARRWATYDGGDHLIVVGEVVGLGETDPRPDGSVDAPLIYHRGGYAHLGDGS